MNDPKGNQVVWFDIPVKNLKRSIAFYSAVLGCAIETMEYGPDSIGVLPHTDNSVGGCLCVDDQNPPSATGPLLYMNCQGRLDEAEAAVVPNGGKVLQTKHPLGPYGFRTVVLDSEGNRVALHSK